MIAGRSVLRETDENPGPNTLDRAASVSLIGNVQWRFTPSAAFTTSQQIYIVNAEYGNRVIDGRMREEGRDRDLTWAGQRGMESETRTPPRVRRAGAIAECDARRSRLGSGSSTGSSTITPRRRRGS